jgi:hypothetical protein
MAASEGEAPVSPRVVPKQERNLDAELVNEYVQRQAISRMGECSAVNPYTPQCSHSFFRDLMLIAESEARKDKAITHPFLRGRDQGAADFSDHDLDEARQRLRTAHWVKDYRDLSVSSANEGLRPSMPGYLAEVWGQAARSTGTLEEAFGTQELLPGMVDTSSNLPVVSIPRLSAGGAVAVQASQNAAIQETDPTTAAASSPVSTVAGQVDLSRQLFEFSQPGFDAAITDDLSRAHATAFDVEVINGNAASGRTRGLLNWSGILSVAGTVTSAATFLTSLWQAYSQLAGSSGFGASNHEGYVTILHPRRAAWLVAGVSYVVARGTPLVPGELVVSAGIPTNLGAGTNEDVALVVERSQVLLLSRGVTVRVREDIGSSSLTVRVQAERHMAVLVKNAAAICKVVALTPPSGF